MRAATTLDVAVIVFSRAPVPGRVKTRLAPCLGAWRAARLHARLTEQALRTARAARCGPVELHDTGKQRGADLGERMHRALSRALRRHRGAIVIGSDCPALRPAHLQQAARWLAGGCDVVLGPAEDGGYVLIAATRVAPRLFDGIAWGGPEVYCATVGRLQACRWRWRALPLLWDVDRPEDLERLEALRYPRLRGLRYASTARRGARR